MEHNGTDGCIILGYQGIGKSSTVESVPGLYIDLESSNFKDENGNRPDDWYIYYCNIAWDLAHQGYRVFTSSHEVVRERFAKLAEEDPMEILIVHPAMEIEEEWIERLQDRYDEHPSEKNAAALYNAKEMYEVNIEDLKKCCRRYGFTDVEIWDTDYFLHDLIEDNLYD